MKVAYFILFFFFLISWKHSKHWYYFIKSHLNFNWKFQMTNNKFIGYKSLPDFLHIFLQTFCLPKQTINDVETKTINYSLTKQTKSNKISCHQSLIPFAEDVIYTVILFSEIRWNSHTNTQLHCMSYPFSQLWYQLVSSSKS